MKQLAHLVVLLLVGCASSPEQKPVTYTIEPFKRMSAFKDDLLYTYALGLQYPNGFDKAEADANAWCPDGHPKCSRDGHPKCSTRDGLDWMLVMGWQDVNFTPWKPKGEGVERLESTFTNDLVDAVWA